MGAAALLRTANAPHLFFAFLFAFPAIYLASFKCTFLLSTLPHEEVIGGTSPRTFFNS